MNPNLRRICPSTVENNQNGPMSATRTAALVEVGSWRLNRVCTNGIDVPFVIPFCYGFKGACNDPFPEKYQQQAAVTHVFRLQAVGTRLGVEAAQRATA